MILNGATAAVAAIGAAPAAVDVGSKVVSMVARTAYAGVQVLLIAGCASLGWYGSRAAAGYVVEKVQPTKY